MGAGHCKKWSNFGVEIMGLTFNGLLEIFKGYSIDMFGGKFPLRSLEGEAEGLACPVNISIVRLGPSLSPRPKA